MRDRDAFVSLPTRFLHHGGPAGNYGVDGGDANRGAPGGVSPVSADVSGIDTLRLTAEEAAGLLERGEVSPEELVAAYREAIAARDGELHAYLHVTETASAGEGRRRPDRAQGRHHDEGRPDDGRVADPRGLHPGLRLDGRRAREGGRPAAPRQDEHGRVRDGLLHGELRVRADAEPLGSRAGARRLVGRLGGRGRGRARALGARHRHGRLGQAAREPLRRRRPAARPTARSRATGSSPSRPRLDQVGPLTKTVRDNAWLYRLTAGHDPVRLDDGRAAGARRAPRARGPEGRPDRDPAAS